MKREEIRRRALRSAAAVAVSMTLFGCGPTVVIAESDAETDPAGEGGAEPARPVFGEADQDLPPVAPVASAPVDAGQPECTPGDGSEAAWAAYQACCDESNWSAPGCMAWGPPMPPAFTGRAVA